MTSKTLTAAASVVVLASLGLAGCGASTSTNTASTSKPASTKTVTTPKKQSKVNSTTVALDSAKGSKVTGTATLNLDAKTHQLMVAVQLSGLAPKSAYSGVIDGKGGSKTGSTMYQLKNITADKSGKATTSTIIKNVKSAPSTGWMININDTSKGSQVVATGNVNQK